MASTNPWILRKMEAVTKKISGRLTASTEALNLLTFLHLYVPEDYIMPVLCSVMVVASFLYFVVPPKTQVTLDPVRIILMAPIALFINGAVMDMSLKRKLQKHQE